MARDNRHGHRIPQLLDQALLRSPCLIGPHLTFSRFLRPIIIKLSGFLEILYNHREEDLDTPTCIEGLITLPVSGELGHARKERQG